MSASWRPPSDGALRLNERRCVFFRHVACRNALLVYGCFERLATNRRPALGCLRTRLPMVSPHMFGWNSLATRLSAPTKQVNSCPCNRFVTPIMTNDFAHRYLVHGVRILSVVELPELDRTQKPRLNEEDEAERTEHRDAARHLTITWCGAASRVGSHHRGTGRCPGP